MVQEQETKTKFYARVSDFSQHEDRQLNAFKEFGDYEKENCYIDKQSRERF